MNGKNYLLAIREAAKSVLDAYHLCTGEWADGDFLFGEMVRHFPDIEFYSPVEWPLFWKAVLSQLMFDVKEVNGITYYRLAGLWEEDEI